ncbi:MULTISPECIES: hypothetical protein [Aquimarina]|uniref:hypothetical protein n=1 Tax=Aquimarina TaxID=290174 RepID=UPI0010436D0F|nr:MULTISPECIES: hypothetical protein [Aquimarina]
MKLKIILTLILITFALNVNAQFPKIKKPKTSKILKKKSGKATNSSKTSTKNVSLDQNVSGTDPKTLKIEKSTVEKIDILKSIFISNENVKKHTKEEIKDALFALDQKLTTLNNFYSDSKRIPEFTTEYDKYKKLVDDEIALRDGGNKSLWHLERISNSVDRIKKGSLEFPNYKEYEAHKEAYQNMGISDPKAEADISNVDNYFENTLTNEIAPKYKKYVIEKLAYKSFNDDEWKMRPKTAIQVVDKTLKLFKDDADIYQGVKDKSWVDDIKNMLITQKQKLNTYIDSGEYDRYFEQYRQRIIDSFRMETPGYNNANLIATIKQKHHNTSKYGTIQRVVLYSNWIVEKNALGVPLEKRITVQVATKAKDGTCQVYEGKLFRTYEGGGKYGGTRYNSYIHISEINCKNINK